MNKQSKHAEGLEKIVDRLKSKPSFTAIKTNLEYKNWKTGQYGEIDVLAYNDGALFIFEYKCTDSVKKEARANNQLDRAVSYFQKCHHFDGPIVTFYVSGDKPEYKMESRIK